MIYENLFEILKYTVPAFIVFLTSYLSIRQLIKNSEQIRKTELILGNKKIITPLKLQAYERFIILLERLALDSLIMRTAKPEMTCKKLHAVLLNAIRTEFEHNLSQQIYISSKAWGFVKGAKENLIKMINIASEKFEAEKPGILLSKELIDQLINIEKHPTQIAIDYLKEEIQAFL